MISNERKQELFNAWCNRSDWTASDREAWETFFERLTQEEQEHIDHIDILFRLWSEKDFEDRWEEQDWYNSLSSDDQTLIDDWDKEYSQAFLQLEQKNAEAENLC